MKCKQCKDTGIIINDITKIEESCIFCPPFENQYSNDDAHLRKINIQSDKDFYDLWKD